MRTTRREFLTFSGAFAGSILMGGSFKGGAKKGRPLISEGNGLRPVDPMPKVAVVGVGGGGISGSYSLWKGIEGRSRFVAVDADYMALREIPLVHKVDLFDSMKKSGLCGPSPERVRDAAEACQGKIIKAVDGCDVALILAGLGDPTARGAGPVVASTCRRRGMLTVGVVGFPFSLEGAPRIHAAKEHAGEMEAQAHLVAVVPNDGLLQAKENRGLTLMEGFKECSRGLGLTTEALYRLAKPESGHCCICWEDIRWFIREMGNGVAGWGVSQSGDPFEALEKALSYTLSDQGELSRVQQAIIYFRLSKTATLIGMRNAYSLLVRSLHPDAEVIINSSLEDEESRGTSATVILGGQWPTDALA